MTASLHLEAAAPGVSVLRFDHGPVSALDTEFLLGLRETLAKTGSDGTALLLTGTGRAFSAGVDLRRFLSEGEEYINAFWPALSGAFEDLLRYPRPVVAAVNGHAIAGGCVIACCADYRIMSAGTIGVPEMSVGIPFPASALAAVRLTVGPGAPALVNSAVTLKAEAARARGLVDEVVAPEDLLERSLAHAVRLAAVPAETFWHTKLSLRRPVLDALTAPASREADTEALRIWTSEAGLGAIAAYMARLAQRT